MFMQEFSLVIQLLSSKTFGSIFVPFWVLFTEISFSLIGASPRKGTPNFYGSVHFPDNGIFVLSSVVLDSAFLFVTLLLFCWTCEMSCQNLMLQIFNNHVITMTFKFRSVRSKRFKTKKLQTQISRKKMSHVRMNFESFIYLFL